MKKRDFLLINGVITVASAVLMVLVWVLVPELGQARCTAVEAVVFALWAVFCGVNTVIYFKKNRK